MADVAVVVHGPAEVAAAVAEETGLPAVVAGDAAALASRSPGAVVGVGADPWPSYAAPHEHVRDALGAVPYYAVQAWHLHPGYLEALVDAVRHELGADAGDTHVLFTAPGPGAEAAPHEVVFLREVAEAVSGSLGLARRSIAWVGGETTPTSATVLTTLVEAHGKTRVLRCSLDPRGRPDGVPAEASAAGVDLREARLAGDSLPRFLAEVVATVVAHEGLAGGVG